MTTQKKTKPVLPKPREPEEEDYYLYERSKTGKHNPRGDMDTYVPLDDKGVPLIVLPKKRKK